MVSIPPDLQIVLAAFGPACRSANVVDLGAAGGFSGARFWRLQTEAGPLCLRRWPTEHPSVPRLGWIHSVLKHAATGGVSFIPLPRLTADGNSWVMHDGHLWEITPWLPGRADFHATPVGPHREARLRAALAALARFHVATANFGDGCRRGASPGISQRRERLQGLLSGGLVRLADGIRGEVWPELAACAPTLLRCFSVVADETLRLLTAAGGLEVPLTPCIRDVWHDHVLFTGDEVTGFVDFGAMRTDSVATDLARLLGSLAGNDADAWQMGLDAYASVRALGGEERSLIEAFDRSGVLLSGVNWLEWVFLERRRFADRPAVLGRMRGILARLEKWALE